MVDLNQTSVSSNAIDPRHPGVVAAHQRLDRIRDDILRLGLERHVLDLELYGYTVLDQIKPLSFFDDLRSTILKLGEEDRIAGRRIPLAGDRGKSYLVTWLLARDRIFEEAVMAEKPLALITYLMGESCQISSNHGHVRGEGDLPQGLHADAPLVPGPIPEAPVASNIMWALDDFTLESGGTLVVPGSHRQRSHPPVGASKMAVPIEARKGSVLIFNGNVRPQEDLNAVISDEVIARNPPRFAHLVGRNNPYPAQNYEFFNPKGAVYFGKTQDAKG